MFEKDNLKIFFKDAKGLKEIGDKSVDLFICGSLYIGKIWGPYSDLFENIYVENGMRVLKDKGYLVLQQTDGYVNNNVFLKSHHLLDLMISNGFKLIDVKIWNRCKMNMFQLPFSYFYIFVKDTNPKGRFEIKSKEYKYGVWNYKMKRGSELNAWGDDLCKLLINTFTKEGDTILDPLSGLSNILTIGSLTGRKCYGYELDKKLKKDIEANYKEKILKGIRNNKLEHVMVG